MITMQAWHSKYHNRPEFLSWFDSEQEYIDAMFAALIMWNYGLWLHSADMLVTAA